MGDMADDFAALREHNREQRAKRRESGTADIEALAELPDPSGDPDATRYSVEDLNNGYHFRIDGDLDLFPTNYRFHNLVTGERGSYTSRPQSKLIEFVDQQLAKAEARRTKRRRA